MTQRHYESRWESAWSSTIAGIANFTEEAIPMACAKIGIIRNESLGRRVSCFGSAMDKDSLFFNALVDRVTVRDNFQSLDLAGVSITSRMPQDFWQW